MAKLQRNNEQVQHYFDELREQFWGDVNQHTKNGLKKFLEDWSERERDQFVGLRWYERYEPNGDRRPEYRNGYYERDWVTMFGTVRIRIARSRGKAFLPNGLRRFQRRADQVALLIREAFLRGISTREVGRVVALVTEEAVSPQTVSRLTRELDDMVKQFHEAQLEDDYVYLYLDGVSLRMRGPDKRNVCICWFATESSETAHAGCWLSCGAKVRARQTGEVSWRICSDEAWRERTWR